MRIAFNGQRLAGQPFGVGRYLEYLLGYWNEQLADGEELSLFVRRPLDKRLAGAWPRIRTVVLESRMPGLPWETLRLGPAAADHDVLFCPAYSAPLGHRGRLVVATHSVNETEPAAHSWLYRQTYARLYKHCARRADAVIVPGERTRRAVEEYYGVPNERLHVVHQGADEAFHPMDDQPDLLSVTRKRFFGSDRPYLLFVGKGSPRRNIPMLIEAFARLRKEGNWPHGLLLFGPYKGDVPFEKLIRDLGVENDVVQTEGVVEYHSDLAPIYAAADIFIHPSENEGWSMTTTEAMAAGTAVIAANRGGLGEVACGHAYMIEPSVDSLVEAVQAVLSDDNLRADLRRKARERGEALRWEKLAQQTLDVVRDVGKRSQRGR
jgi:glycosyltransferase involved in cell wall biosynthesis